MALICSKLTSDSNNSEFLAIPDKNSALARRQKDKAVLAVVNIHIGSDIENKVKGIFAIVDIVLLLFD